MKLRLSFKCSKKQAAKTTQRHTEWYRHSCAHRLARCYYCRSGLQWQVIFSSLRWPPSSRANSTYESRAKASNQDMLVSSGLWWSWDHSQPYLSQQNHQGTLSSRNRLQDCGNRSKTTSKVKQARLLLQKSRQHPSLKVTSLFMRCADDQPNPSLAQKALEAYHVVRLRTPWNWLLVDIIFHA